MTRKFAAAILVLGMAGCGGGGGGSGDGAASASGWTPGVFLPSDTWSTQCAVPRDDTHPISGRPWPDVQGSTLDENNWLRSWSHELYLWYDEIEDRDPALYETLEYFHLLKTFGTTPSGARKDQFHFVFPTDEWLELSQSGVGVGYGATWALIADTPPREIVVAYTEPQPDWPAVAAGVARGARVLAVDGVDVATGPAATLNAGLFPAAEGETHEFTIQDAGATAPRTVTLEAIKGENAPVQNIAVTDTPLGPVGYLLFNDHIATAENALIGAIGQLRDAGVTDLVLDIRYNGGGFLDIASELAFMIAGTVPTAGRTFERLQFSDKHPTTNPVTGEPLAPMPFHSTSQGFSVADGVPLPTLDLPRVYVLTGPSTCSASESIMNGLRGVDVEVIQIGSTTCGKPYGFFGFDNCGTTYFSIQFRGVNEKGFGDYADGFTPQNSTAASAVALPGCAVADDFSHELGDTEEARFAAALAYREGQGCSLAAQAAAAKPGRPSAADGRVRKGPWLENRMLVQ